VCVCERASASASECESVSACLHEAISSYNRQDGQTFLKGGGV
jgi:hypothetical protein